MRRLAVALAAILAAAVATPSFAAGTSCVRTVNDVSGTHLQSYFDESGASTAGAACTGTGPFDPVTAGPSGSASSNQYPGSDYAKDGTDNTGVSQPASGIGIRGWLSGIYKAVTGTLNVTNSPATGATITTSQPSVTTTAAALTFSGTVHREIANPAASGASIFIGASGVTTSTGWEIPAGASYDVSRFSGTLYAIAPSNVTARLISY